MADPITVEKTWRFAAAQTNAQLEAVSATQRMIVLRVSCTTDAETAGNVSVEIGFGTATLATLSDNSLTGAVGIFYTHPGISPGGGKCETMGGAALGQGGVDEDLRIKCSAATGGHLDVTVQYRMVEDQ